jgi:predicted nucleic acid-binding protein
MRIYFDNCCLSRTLDDQTQNRVRLETQAIRLIFEHLTRGEWTLIGSDAVDHEAARIRDPERRRSVEVLVEAAAEHVSIDANLRRRGKQLAAIGFRGYDSLHIACAEAADADVLLTTDDAFVRRARRLQHEVKVRVANPLTWLKERPE